MYTWLSLVYYACIASIILITLRLQEIQIKFNDISKAGETSHHASHVL